MSYNQVRDMIGDNQINCILFDVGRLINNLSEIMGEKEITQRGS